MSHKTKRNLFIFETILKTILVFSAIFFGTWLFMSCMDTIANIHVSDYEIPAWHIMKVLFGA